MSKEIKKERKIFLDHLPRGNGYGVNKNQINWKESIGYTINFIYDNINGSLKIIDYIRENNKSYLIIKYDNVEFKIHTNDFKSCGLGKILKKYTKDFKIEIGTRFKDDKRDITITDREYKKDKNKNNIKWYKYTCNKCGWTEGWKREPDVFAGYGCTCCCGTTSVLGINTIWDTDKWMMPIINDDEFCKTHTSNCMDKIFPTCPDCGRKSKKAISINNLYKHKKISCYCQDGFSYPNKFAYDLLIKLNINFESEKYFDWCKYTYKNKIKRGYYDFYFILNNKKYIIEMDGGFHSKDNKMNGITKEESQYIDNEKDKLAKEHGIEVIRINCDYSSVENRFEYIKQNILNSKINQLFNLSEINWLEIEKFALNNLVEIACKYKNDYPNLTTKEIGKLMGGYNASVIVSWLKRGNGIWCNYDAKEEHKKSCSKNGKSLGKQVEIFKDGISLGIFPSCAEIGRKSEELFGIKLAFGGVSAVCIGKKPQYKGFTFKYV